MGYFDNDRKEYVITDMFPRRPLINYLWNENTVFQCNQFGFGFSWSLFGSNRRQIDKGVRNLYVKDLDTNEFYSANRNYNRLPFERYLARVGLGYHVVESQYNGLNATLTAVVPKEGHVVLYKAEITNTTDKAKNIDIVFCNQPTPDISGHESYGLADYNKAINGIDFAHEGYNVSSEYKHVYLVADKKATGYETSESAFTGAYGSFAEPDSLKGDLLRSRAATFENFHVGALQYRLSLEKGQKWQVVFACGLAKNLQECVEYSKKYANQAFFEQALAEQKIMNQSQLDTFVADTPDEYMDVQANIWLKRQVSVGKTWGRLYGKGFRDVLQDITAFVSMDSEFARERILSVLKWQYEDGNPIRMFDPCMYYPYNDGGSWIPMTVLQYLNESGDVQILDEKVRYLRGTSKDNCNFARPTKFAAHDSTDYAETTFEHVKKAVDYLYSCRGERGLVLFLGGDWNDSLNNAGRLGKGESVWLTIATIKAHNDFIEILKIYKKQRLISVYKARRDELIENVLKHGLDGDHLIYGYNDYGEKIGSDQNDYAKIFLNAQTWAVLANLGDKEMLEGFMDQVESRLKCDFGYVQCAPSFRKGTDKIGRVSYFQPGMVENGSVYNHGVAFKIVADCMLGRAENAYNSLKAISYDNPLNTNNGVEPYAVSNMYIGPEDQNLKGYAPMSWITGTAGWLYRCITEYICGVQATFDGLKLKPCVPQKWKEYSVKRKFRGAQYDVKFIRSTENKIILNGKEITGKVLPVQKSGTCNSVVVYFN